MERATQQLTDILQHYIGHAVSVAGGHWDWENAGEVGDAVQGFADAIETSIKERVKLQLEAAGLKIEES